MGFIVRVITLVLLVFLLYLFGATLYRFYTSPKVVQEVSSISAGYGWVNAFIVDLDGNKDFTQNGIMGGDDGVLTVHMGDNPNMHQEDIIQGKDVLMEFDVNHDGIIDARDPVYPRLEIVFFNKKKSGQLTHTLIMNMGIRAILLDPTLVAQAVKERPSIHADTVGVAVFADGSQRLINQVSIYGPAFKEQ